jgi:uncharacterized LabA/DUF88 family protein
MNTNASSDNLPTNINKTQGNYAFIDSQNLNLGLKNIVKNKLGKVLHSGWDLDFARFRIFLKDKYKVKKAFLFIGFMPGNEKLYQYLQEAGYICIFKPTLAIKSDGKNKIKGNCDAELVLHSMIEIDNYNKAIIVSGDGDFYCLIEYLKEKNKLEKVLIPNQFTYSSLLKKFTKNLTYLNIAEIAKKLKNPRNLSTDTFGKRGKS